MLAQNTPNGQEPSYVPDLGTLMVDTGHGNRTGEFRGLDGPYWSLRPVNGGVEWETVPEQVRTPTPVELGEHHPDPGAEADRLLTLIVRGISPRT
ncbi:hypothetical protein OHA44_21520 [Streptomyces sp. NBC_00144]